jgi:hypothetical protein
MHAVRMMAACLVGDILPPRQLCAAFDVGALRYYSERPSSTCGLIDPNAVRCMRQVPRSKFSISFRLVLLGTGRTDEGSILRILASRGAG